MTPVARFQLVVPVFCLAACATAPEAPPPAPAPAPVISSVEPIVPAAAPVKPAKPAKPKPVKKADKPADAAATRAADAAAAPPPPAPVAKIEPPIQGPAWLEKCSSKRKEGGAILCDTDSLLANPSANVKVYAREENLAGPVANGGRIEYRPGLPRRYRLFIVP